MSRFTVTLNGMGKLGAIANSNLMFKVTKFGPMAFPMNLLHLYHCLWFQNISGDKESSLGAQSGLQKYLNEQLLKQEKYS